MTAFIAGYARTPFTKFTGQLASEPATALGAHAIKAALENAGISAEDVDLVVAGQVLQGGAGQNPARQSSIGAGISYDVPAITLNAVCLSGAEAVVHANRLIATGEADVVVAVGQESMSQAPHVANLRAATKYGPATFKDTVDYDGLTDAFENIAMGALTEDGNAELNINRQEQDEVAARSHQLAEKHADKLAEEIAPYTVKTRKGEVVIDADDGVRAGTTAESLGGLRPAFAKDGTITAGNASQITDGAAAVVVLSEKAAEKLGVKPLASIESTGFVSGPGIQLHSQPSNAINAALEKAGAKASDLEVVEINEAFAAVAIQSAKDLGIDMEKVNPQGGAIALGHPIGASGARIIGSLAKQLAAKGSGSLGAIGICGGGGQGTAMILKSV